MNYQKKVAILTDFWQKKTAERSRNEEINRKSEKINYKIKKYVPILNFSGSAKYCGINFRSLHFHIASNRNYFYKKQNYNKKNGPLRRKNGH